MHISTMAVLKAILKTGKDEGHSGVVAGGSSLIPAHSGLDDQSDYILPVPARADCALWGSAGVGDLGLVAVGAGGDCGADACAHAGGVDACG